MPEEQAVAPTPPQEPAAPAAPAAPVEPAAPAAQEPVTPPVSEAPAQGMAPQDPAPTAPEAPPADPGSDPATPDAAPAAEPVALTLPEGTPQQVGEFFNQHGFTQEQAEATIQNFGAYIQQEESGRQQALRSMGEAHLKNWGQNADHNLSLAKRALKQNDPDGELAKALNESGYGNHPAVLNFLHRLGKGMQEGGYLKSAVHRPPGKKTAAQAMYGDNHPSIE